MTSLPGFRGSVVAIDWSGAKARSAQTSTIRVAVVRDDTAGHGSGGRTRAETIDLVLALEPPVLVGFDFSFGFPAWFAREQGCASIDDAWALAEDDGESMLAPTPPFWRDRCIVPPDQRFRRCEDRLRAQGFPAKSIFQLVGNGQVGAGSVRGMPFLARLRGTGFAIWPFEQAAERTAFEIYPSLLRKLAPHHDVGPFTNEHERDAVVSARVMWEHRESFAALEAATDPTTLIEGDVWVPPASASP